MQPPLPPAVGQSAQDLFRSGLFCAESVVLAVARAQGVASPLLPRLASAFCSGMARTGGPCGALTGAVMGVGLALGRSNAGDPVQPAYAATQRLVQEFEARFGSRDCRALLDGCDLNTPAGQAKFQEQGLAQRCVRYTGAAAEIAARVIADGR
ncbi:C-GCAxxG-C-C family protein [Ramlibacter sp.]|uniref:C-GCAxxG-C-C family protein n=1 Tax=Ramlibacter sp. TaxID=1917967 RepID=UPI002D040459|nr:C-GCAxxG-C-C family protein [Ramlibacter sp.]HWI82799.1 C-GCAxxG-C-C family protein [Ramlibacter sp.]